MKRIKLLLIISVLLFFNCTNNNEKKHKKEKFHQTDSTEINSSIDTIQTVFNSTELQKDSLNTTATDIENQQDSAQKNNEIKKSLKVIIEGKTYYKRNINDKPVKGGHKTHFYNEKTNKYYDVVTKKSIFIYGKHGIILKDKTTGNNVYKK